MTLLSLSLKATAPAAFRRPNSVISSPCMPLVSAAIGRMLTIAVSRARRITKSTVAELSMTGSVSGWQMMVVTPPVAAAWLAEANVSRWLKPGSPTKARMSIRPGATILPEQLTMSVPSGTPASSNAAAGLADGAVGDQDVADAVKIPGGIDDAGIGKQNGSSIDQHGHHAFGRLRASASSTAMRTATPISTCSRIRDCAPSATAVSISTPRFMGPGCITSASGFA
ncbi:hypothetical protein ACVWW4_008867 [Bradyrhizobium sp. LB7.1]